MKQTSRHFRPIATFGLFFLLVLSGCDSFSILDEFKSGSKAGQLALSVQQTSVLRGNTTELYPSGGTPPYDFSVMEETFGDLYFPGTTGSVSGQTYTAGTAIGKIKIRVTDAASGSAAVYVTIIPPAPTALNVVRSVDQKSATVSWSYTEIDIIEKFRLERSMDGGAFSAIDFPGSGTTSVTYPNSLAPANKTYSYRLYAVSGSYESLSTPVVSSAYVP